MKFHKKQVTWRDVCIGMTVFFTFFLIICNGCGGGGGDDKSPTLSSITVTPATPLIPLGTTKAFTAMGTYSDGSTQNITATATWTSSNNGVATVASSGIAISVSQGTAEIRAAVNSISGNTTLTVNPPALVSIAVSPTAPIVYYQGATKQFSAIGTYTDNSTADITNAVTWQSSNPGVASIDSEGFSKIAAITGATNIQAISGTITGGTTITIQTSTVKGQITIPESDMGWQPSLYSSSSKVRVQGTDIEADVVATSNTTGTFTLTGVPRGTVTLIFEEDVNTSSFAQQDSFTQSSKRAAINVNADTIDGVSFNLVYHWSELAGYPSRWGQLTSQGVPTSWIAQFISDQIALVLFRVDNSPDPESMELYRTLDRGAHWSMIGQWPYNTTAYPAWWLDFHFLDQDHGVVLLAASCIPCGACGAGYYYTADGGQTWNTTGLPLAPMTGYDIKPSVYAQISSTHLIMGGTVGCGVQGYGSGFYDAIWESTDSGATWDLKWNSVINESGNFIGLDANASGNAVGFRGGSVQQFLLRDTQGNWTTKDNTYGIYNASRDLSMVDDTSWIISSGGTASNGLYQTTDAGQSWGKISDGLPQDYDFATLKKGFTQAGGPAMVTYDGGITWLYQAAGGAVWPGNMNIWAFDATHAAWAEGGYGDPNGTAQLFTYVEPWDQNFEILSSSTPPDSNVSPASTNVPMASYQLNNNGPVPIKINNLKLYAGGTGNDAVDITAVKLWWDRNDDGTVNSGDTLLGTGTYSANNGTVNLAIGPTYPLEQFNPMQVLITYNFASGITSARTYRFSLNMADVNAQTTDTDTAVLPNAPAGFSFTSRKITVSP